MFRFVLFSLKISTYSLRVAMILWCLAPELSFIKRRHLILVNWFKFPLTTRSRLFKLFLSQWRGAIFCKNGGSRNWHGGSNTEFSTSSSNFQCEASNSYVLLLVEKNEQRLLLQSNGQEIFVMNFNAQSGNCPFRTNQINVYAHNFGSYDRTLAIATIQTLDFRK